MMSVAIISDMNGRLRIGVCCQSVVSVVGVLVVASVVSAVVASVVSAVSVRVSAVAVSTETLLSAVSLL